MKTAQQLLDELLLDIKPPQGCAISLTEEIPKTHGGPNWVSAIGVVSDQTLSRYRTKVGELRKSDPHVDWSTVTDQPGKRRHISKWPPKS